MDGMVHVTAAAERGETRWDEWGREKVERRGGGIVPSVQRLRLEKHGRGYLRTDSSNLVSCDRSSGPIGEGEREKNADCPRADGVFGSVRFGAVR